MPEPRPVKLIEIDGSQAVLLPAGFRFDGDEVFATRDATTGIVTLSAEPGTATWARFFALAGSIDDDPEFRRDRPMDVVAIDRRSFDDEGWHPPDPLDRLPHEIAR